LPVAFDEEQALVKAEALGDMFLLRQLDHHTVVVAPFGMEPQQLPLPFGPQAATLPM
jgi:hypothetical protein